MRFLFIWLVLLATLFAVTIEWYYLSPPFLCTLENLNGVVTTSNLPPSAQGTWDLVYNMVRNTWMLWIPILLTGGFLTWAYLASIKREYESYTMGE